MGQAGRTVERLADHGLIALVVSNTPQAMAFHGGKRAMLGTNPLAFAAPLPGRAPLVIDLSLSLVARAKIVAAQKAGHEIPSGWATAADGTPTSDPDAALAGALLPAGGAKGAALALMVEILCAALAGGQFGWEASSFLDTSGAAPSIGQVLIAFDPAAFSGAEFPDRMTTVLTTVAGEPGVRLPGDRRLASRETALRQGIKVAPELHAHLVKIAQSGVIR
jgi:(2R)-3-sulfolactate dehydrogenase (NADP+)